MSVPTDIGGLVFPQLPGQTVDRLQLAHAGRCAEAAMTQLRKQSDLLPAASAMLAALAAADRLGVAACFRNPLAPFDTKIGLQDDLPDPRTALQRAAALVRHLAGAPDIGAFTVVLTESEVPEDLLLPHLGILLRGLRNHVVALHQSEGRLRLVRDDGLLATFVVGSAPPAGTEHPMFRSAPRVHGYDVLNADPTVAAALGHLGVAQGAALELAMARLDRGLDLLSALWPGAAEAMSRHVGGFVLLASRDYERSHSPVGLCGAIALTTGAPVTIGDLLCHESSHIRMHWFKAVDPLIVARHPTEAAAGFDSPWRSDKRPLDGINLGVHAFLNVCTWYQRVAENGHPLLYDFARRIHDRQALNVRTGFDLLSTAGRTTDLGRQLIDAYAEAVVGLGVAASGPKERQDA